MLEFKVTKQAIKRVDREDPATDSVDYLEAKFDFTTSDWDGTVKTALFRLGTKVYKSVVNSSGVCTVPWEVLVSSSESTSSLGNKNKVFVSMTGTTGSIVITTNEIRVDLETSGKAYGDGENSGTPTATEFEQFVETVKEEVAKINDTSDDVKNAAQEVQDSIDQLSAEIDEAQKLAESNEETAEIILNETANAFKGTVSGGVVRVDDVSPIEHSAKVKVHGRNLIPYPYAEAFGEDRGLTYTDNGDGTIGVSGTVTDSFSSFIIANKLSLEVGTTYYVGSSSKLLFAYKDEYGKTNYLSDGTITWSANYTFVCLYLQWSNGNVVDETIEPMLCIAGTSTEYTPYIDPSTVTVTSRGKNLIPYPHTSSLGTVDGITYSEGENGILRVSGTTTKGTNFFFSMNQLIKKGTYTLSGAENFSGMTVLIYSPSLSKTIASLSGGDEYVTFTLDEDVDDCNIYLNYAYADQNVSGYVQLQLEVGETATDYETYKEATEYTPNSDGACEIGTVSPIMTLLTDTEGVTIECEYNRDTNIVMGDIEAAIDSILELQNTIIGGESS